MMRTAQLFLVCLVLALVCSCGLSDKIKDTEGCVSRVDYMTSIGGFPTVISKQTVVRFTDGRTMVFEGHYTGFTEGRCYQIEYWKHHRNILSVHEGKVQ